MIHAKELRLGNIVTVDNQKHHPKLKGTPLIVMGVSENNNGICVNLEHIHKQPNTCYETYSQLIDFLEPITINDKLLLKCGFEKKDPIRCTMLLSLDDSYTINDNMAPTLQWWIGKDYVSVCRSGIGAKSAKCNSLHQLQNLYFALTGKELEVKL